LRGGFGIIDFSIMSLIFQSLLSDKDLRQKKEQIGGNGETSVLPLHLYH